MGNVTIFTSDVPSTLCHSDWRTTWPTLVALLSANFDGDEFNFGNETPSAEHRDRPWFRTNADGTPDRLYSYSSGSWLALHPLAPGLVMMYEGAEAGIPTLDSGEAGTVSASTGPFWEKVTALDARIPIGPGTLPLSGTSITVGGNTGVDQVTLTESEMPEHTHTFLIGGSGDTHGGKIDAVNLAENTRTFQTDSAGGGQPHNNMPPVYGIWFIRRTARTLYRL